MKNILLIAGLLVHSFCTMGQEYQTVRKVVTIQPEQSFYLNGGLRATVGGKSRILIPVDLPPNTIGWVYSFSTTGNPQSMSNLKLAAQLTRLVDPTGATELATEAIFAPTGVAAADIYLCDGQNIELFMQKVDKSGGRFQYRYSGTRENMTHGVVPIKTETKGRWYLGIRNPSAAEGINVNIEIVAVVEERVPVKRN